MTLTGVAAIACAAESELALEGRLPGVSGPDAPGDSSLLASIVRLRFAGFSRLCGSSTVGGGVSLESIKPISSMAPPSMSVNSLIVPPGAADTGRGTGTVPATVCVRGRVCSTKGDEVGGRGVDRVEEGS